MTPKTAYCPLFKTQVEILSEHVDPRGELLYSTRFTDPDDHVVYKFLFRSQELEKFTY